MYILGNVKFEVSPKQYQLTYAESLLISVSDKNQAPRGVFRGGHWAMPPSLGRQNSIISI